MLKQDSLHNKYMNELLPRIIPIFLLILTGYLLKRTSIISDNNLKFLKTMTVTLFLPCSLFLAFTSINLSVNYLMLFILTLVFMIILFAAGRLLKITRLFSRIYTAEFFTGFEFGMVGVALFSAVFGAEGLSVISLVGLGHELFIWFIYLPFLKSHSEGKPGIEASLAGFIKSPIIIAILIAVILNVFNLKPSFIYGSGVITAVTWLSQATVPVVLLIVGAGINLHNIEFGRSFIFTITRLVIVLLLGSVFYFILIRIIPELPELFFYAWFTFILLPPPFIIPIYIGAEHKEDMNFFSNTIILYTLTGLILFVIFLMIFPPAV